MDYSQLSDFEINKRVALALGHSIDKEKYGKASVGVFHIDGIVYKSYDYCNNPADAWSIIVENRIRILPILYTQWMAEDYLEDVSSTHENPLRAAMIVFLMMQDTK